MNKSLIVGVIITTLLVIGGFVWFFVISVQQNTASPINPAAAGQGNTPPQNLPPMPSPQPATGGQQKVTIKNYAFNPSQLTVKVGTEVQWVNEDSANHLVTGADFRSQIMGPGETYSHTFSAPGSFDYYCSLHPEMKGRIVVEE